MSIQTVNHPQSPGRAIAVPIGPGELFDKLTILAIKAERITDAAKQRHVLHELALVEEVRQRELPSLDRLKQLTAELRRINEALWDIEDEIRECERCRDFGSRFVTLARSVYKTNDRRAALKREINELLGSAIVEEKSYTGPSPDRAESEPWSAPRTPR